MYSLHAWKHLYQIQNRCVKSSSIFFTNQIQIRTPHDGIYVLFCANSRKVVFIEYPVRLLLKGINSARSSLFQKRECWDEKHIKSCDNKPRTRKSTLLFEGTILDRCFQPFLQKYLSRKLQNLALAEP